MRAKAGVPMRREGGLRISKTLERKYYKERAEEAATRVRKSIETKKSKLIDEGKPSTATKYVKLSEEQVQHIKWLWANGHTIEKIMRISGQARHQIYNIVTKRVFKDLPPYRWDAAFESKP